MSSSTRYQVLWDNRASKFARRSAKAAAAAPKGNPQVVGDVHSIDNGLYGHVNFGPGERRVADAVAKELKAQGYLGVSVWDTLNNPLSRMFRLG